MKRPYLTAIALLALICCSFIPQNKQRETSTANNIKVRALEILETKCNSCHSSQNSSRVFTLDNMDRYAAAIYKQVFVWRRMPRKNATVLSPEEQEELKCWLRAHTEVRD